MDIHAEDLGNNTNNCIQVQADLDSFCQQMNEYFDHNKNDMNHGIKADWWKLLNEKVAKNKAVIQVINKIFILIYFIS